MRESSPPIATRSYHGGPRLVQPPRLTGPLHHIQGGSPLVICDVENLSLGAWELGFFISYGSLAGQFKAVTRRCGLHAFFWQKRNENHRVSHFESCGWIAHGQAVETVRSCRGEYTRANSDNTILFCTGVLATLPVFDTIIIGSGDGDLVCDLARLLSEFNIKRRIFTLSLAGSTSSRLNAERNPHIHANLEIGMDCLHASSLDTEQGMEG